MDTYTQSPEASEAKGQVESYIRSLLDARRNPSAWELVQEIEQHHGWKARWALKDTLSALAMDSELPRYYREYLESLLHGKEIDEALAGSPSPRKEVQTGIDMLVQRSRAYRESWAFQEMIDFMGRFRDYAPYNNMLVRIQNPSCSFYATQSDWWNRFRRTLKEDARPMLILAPMHPVMLVYEVDQTEGKELPTHLNEFAKFRGDWDVECLKRTVENAARRDRIRVDFKHLSSTNAGFATIARADRDFKMRIAIHENLEAPSRFGVLCHELAHIYLGHLGTDEDHWWPSRTNLSHKTVEIEAEAVAFLVTSRLGLQGASASYVSRYLTEDEIPESVSLDLIAKVAGRIEEMTKRKMEERVPRRERKEPRSQLI